MNTPIRDQWISSLESAARESPDAISSEWNWILKQLKLPLEFFPYVLEAIRQQRWKTARNPKSYIRRVAWRESAKANVSSRTGIRSNPWLFRPTNLFPWRMRLSISAILPTLPTAMLAYPMLSLHLVNYRSYKSTRS